MAKCEILPSVVNITSPTNDESVMCEKRRYFKHKAVWRAVKSNLLIALFAIA